MTDSPLKLKKML